MIQYLLILEEFVLPVVLIIAWFYKSKNPNSLIHLIRGLACLALILMSLAFGDFLATGISTLFLFLIAHRAANQANENKI